jgi:hypothetical protein
MSKDTLTPNESISTPGNPAKSEATGDFFTIFTVPIE